MPGAATGGRHGAGPGLPRPPLRQRGAAPKGGSTEPRLRPPPRRRSSGCSAGPRHRRAALSRLRLRLPPPAERKPGSAPPSCGRAGHCGRETRGAPQPAPRCPPGAGAGAGSPETATRNKAGAVPPSPRGAGGVPRPTQAHAGHRETPVTDKQLGASPPSSEESPTAETQAAERGCGGSESDQSEPRSVPGARHSQQPIRMRAGEGVLLGPPPPAKANHSEQGRSRPDPAHAPTPPNRLLPQGGQ